MITSEDIDKFARLYGDPFYAHQKKLILMAQCLLNKFTVIYYIRWQGFIDSYKKKTALLNYGLMVFY
jgi:hypothetical protein